MRKLDEELLKRLDEELLRRPGEELLRRPDEELLSRPDEEVLMRPDEERLRRGLKSIVCVVLCILVVIFGLSGSNWVLEDDSLTIAVLSNAWTCNFPHEFVCKRTNATLGQHFHDFGRRRRHTRKPLMPTGDAIACIVSSWLLGGLVGWTSGLTSVGTFG